MSKLKSEKILVIPDIHQDIKWVDEILKEEAGFDKVILLGDLFDCYDSTIRANVSDTLRYITELKKQLKDKCVILVGNHDIPYYATFRYVNNIMSIRSIDIKYACSGNTLIKAREIMSVLADGNKDFIYQCKLAHYENGILFTHAGLHSEVFKAHNISKSTKLPQQMKAFCKYANTYWCEKFPKYNLLLACGTHRGGFAAHGGIVWQDMKDCVRDENLLQVTQVFGHTAKDKRIHNHKNLAYCLDGNQTIYGVIEGDVMTIKRPSYQATLDNDSVCDLGFRLVFTNNTTGEGTETEYTKQVQLII